MRKPMMVGVGPVVGKDWGARSFTLESARSYMDRTMSAGLREKGFVAVVAEFGDHFRGSYAAMPTDVRTGRAGR